MAESNEILTDVAKTIGGTLGAVVGSAEAMKDKVLAAVEKTPSFGGVKRTAKKRMAFARREVARAAGRTKRAMRTARATRRGRRATNRAVRKAARTARAASAATRRTARKSAAETRTRIGARGRKGSSARRRK